MIDDTRGKLCEIFNALHDRLSEVRDIMRQLDDDKASELFGAMESGLLAPMRRLRVHLDIPYHRYGKYSVKEIPME